MLIVNLVDGADVWMVQRGGSLGFALEAAECLRVFGNVVGQKLKGDEAAEVYVLSFINHTHAAAAEFLDDAVVRDGLADHVWPIIFGRSCLADRVWPVKYGSLGARLS